MKLVLYVMRPKEADGHSFLAIRKTKKNKKGKYVTGDQVYGFGLVWPTSVAKTRDELATVIGKALLDEIEYDETLTKNQTFVVPLPKTK